MDWNTLNKKVPKNWSLSLRKSIFCLKNPSDFEFSFRKFLNINYQKDNLLNSTKIPALLDSFNVHTHLEEKDREIQNELFKEIMTSIERKQLEIDQKTYEQILDFFFKKILKNVKHFQSLQKIFFKAAPITLLNKVIEQFLAKKTQLSVNDLKLLTAFLEASNINLEDRKGIFLQLVTVESILKNNRDDLKKILSPTDVKELFLKGINVDSYIFQEKLWGDSLIKNIVIDCKSNFNFIGRYFSSLPNESRLSFLKNIFHITQMKNEQLKIFLASLINEINEEEKINFINYLILFLFQKNLPANGLEKENTLLDPMTTSTSNNQEGDEYFEKTLLREIFDVNIMNNFQYAASGCLFNKDINLQVMNPEFVSNLNGQMDNIDLSIQYQIWTYILDVIKTRISDQAINKFPLIIQRNSLRSNWHDFINAKNEETASLLLRLNAIYEKIPEKSKTSQFTQLWKTLKQVYHLLNSSPLKEYITQEKITEQHSVEDFEKRKLETMELQKALFSGEYSRTSRESLQEHFGQKAKEIEKKLQKSGQCVLVDFSREISAGNKPKKIVSEEDTAQEEQGPFYSEHIPLRSIMD